MKIAFVRGSHLNHYELQCYAPLAKRHEFYAVGADWQVRPSELSEDVPVRRAHAWGAALAGFSPRLPVLWNRALSWTLGQSYGLYDLPGIAGRPDILHSGETYSTQTYQCLKLKRRLGCGLVVTVWENLPHMGELHPLRRRRKREVIAEADGFVAVTETSQRMLIQEGIPEDKIQVIPCGVDQRRFTPATKDPELMQRYGLKPEDLVILFIGRYVPEKGVPQLLKALPGLLQNRLPRVLRFLFVGAGPLEGKIAQMREQVGETVILSPFVGYEDIPKVHRLADIFVLPSQPRNKVSEQFGHVLAESLSCGKAIVTTRVGSIPDVVGDAAILVPPNDAAALEAALLDLIVHPGKRDALSKRALARARETLDREQCARMIEHFYERVISKIAPVR